MCYEPSPDISDHRRSYRIERRGVLACVGSPLDLSKIHLLASQKDLGYT